MTMKKETKSKSDPIKKLASPKRMEVGSGNLLYKSPRSKVANAVRSGATTKAKAGGKGRRIQKPVLSSSVKTPRKSKPTSPTSVKRMRKRKKKERI